MKKHIQFPSFALIAGALMLGSCSDDKDEPTLDQNPNPGDETVVNPQTVFSQGVPSQVGDLVITQNAQGLVTKIVEDEETETLFNYDGANSAQKVRSRADVTIPTDYDMSFEVKEDDKVKCVFYATLNAQGYIEYAYEIEKDNDPETAEEWWFKYNGHGQMIELKRTEGDNEVTTITYDTNGDITTVKVKDDIDGEKEITTIKYTDTANTTPIINKSGIMLYDYSLRIDMDEMAPAYFAGLLGKGTAHLPLSAVSTYTSEGTTSISNYAFSWELNADNMPIRFTSVQPLEWGDETDTINFKW